MAAPGVSEPLASALVGQVEFLAVPFLFILCLVALMLLAVASLPIWLAIRHIIDRRRMAALQAEWRREHFDADGTPLPPTAPGLCDACQKASEKVYYMPSGRRLCEACRKESSGCP
jgi:hypothetical protein